MVNARNHDLLPGVMWDRRTVLDFDDRLSRRGELADSLLQLVDQGLIEVRRLLREDRYEVVAREHLGDVLADAAVWSYSERGWDHRDEGLAKRGDSGRAATVRNDRSGVPERVEPGAPDTNPSPRPATIAAAATPFINHPLHNESGLEYQ